MFETTHDLPLLDSINTLWETPWAPGCKYSTTWQDMMPDLMYLQPQPKFCLIILVILCVLHFIWVAHMLVCTYVYIYTHNHMHPCIYVCKYIYIHVCILYICVCVIWKITSQNHVKISTCNSRPGRPLALAQSSSAVSTGNASSCRLSKAWKIAGRFSRTMSYPSAGAKL